MQLLTVILQAGLIAGTLTAAGLVFTQRSLDVAAAPFAIRLRQWAALVALVCAMAGLGVLIVRLAGGYDAGIASMVLTSSSGIAAGATVLGAVLVLLPGATALAGAAILAVAAGIAGHASAEWLPGGIVVALHAGAAAWWLGGLVLLLRASVDNEADRLPKALVRFSKQAKIAVLVLLAAGGWLAVDLVGLSTVAYASDYGRVFLLKLAGVACLLGIALYNRVRLTPAILAGQAAARGRLHRTIRAELVLVGLIIAVTATLSTVMLPPHP